jgi:hypothetical protein
MVARVRMMMLISLLTTFGAVAVVVGIIIYKLAHTGEGKVATASPQLIENSVALPAGARVVSTAVADNRLVVTIDAGEATEVRSFDIRTMKLLGRLRFSHAP